jgi:hypothetical protein
VSIGPVATTPSNAVVRTVRDVPQIRCQCSYPPKRVDGYGPFTGQSNLVMMARGVPELDVTRLIELASGPRGGYRIVVDSLHLNDVLLYSGIKEPGDAAYVGPTSRVWAATEYASRWVRLVADEVVVEGSWDRPGAVLQVDKESGGSWRFRMPDQLWAALVREVVSQVGFPRFQTARSNRSVELER